MPALGILPYTLWVAPHVVQAIILAILLRKGLRRQFPFFFAYLVFEISSFVLLFAVLHEAPMQYFYAYWTTSILGSMLTFAAIYEAFRHSLQRFGALQEFAGILFRWVLGILLAVGVLFALTSQGPGAMRVVAGLINVDRGVRVVQCGLVLFLLFFTQRLGLSLRSHSFAIATGFGISGATELAITTIHSYWPSLVGPLLSNINAAVFNVAVALWVVALALPDVVPEKYSPAAQWDQALGGETESSAEPFLPYLERAVERVLARRQPS